MKHESTQLGPYFDAYIERRTDLGWQTIQTLKHTRKVAAEYFGARKRMDAVTAGDAKDFRRHVAAGRATATVAMYIKKLRQLWADAIDHELLTGNPWKAVKPGSQVNTSRQTYVPAATILKVIEHCPTIEWKLLFALARFAGMRVPSEPIKLRWGDINFDAGKIIVHSSKTKHHPGKDMRVTPLFRELFPELERLLIVAMGQAEDGDQYVLGRKRLHRNMATTAKKIITRAGFAPWPRLWTNLRASCETDLATVHPIHVVCSFIGNSIGVAKAHYLQVTESDFALANTGTRKMHKPTPTVAKIIQSTQETMPLVSFPTGSSHQADSLGVTQAIHDAIQAVLRREKRRLATFDQTSLSKIRRGIATAKRGRR